MLLFFSKQLLKTFEISTWFVMLESLEDKLFGITEDRFLVVLIDFISFRVLLIIFYNGFEILIVIICFYFLWKILVTYFIYIYLYCLWKVSFVPKSSAFMNLFSKWFLIMIDFWITGIILLLIWTLIYILYLLICFDDARSFNIELMLSKNDYRDSHRVCLIWDHQINFYGQHMCMYNISVSGKIYEKQSDMNFYWRRNTMSESLIAFQ